MNDQPFAIVLLLIFSACGLVLAAIEVTTARFPSLARAWNCVLMLVGDFLSGQRTTR